MKIIEFKAERFKRLSAVEIHPSSNVVSIEGKNGQGKSSVLDAIWLTLAGAKGAKECGTIRPIKDGECDAVVRLDLGDIIATRKWRDSGSSVLTVESKDGKIFSSPQAILDSLVGDLMFDPLAFSRLSAKEQRNKLIDLVQLEINPDELDAKRKEVYDNRTLVNRELKQFEAEFSAIPAQSAETPDSEVSVSALMNEFNSMCTSNAAIAEDKKTLESMRERAAEIKRQVENLNTELSDLIERGKTLAAKVSAAHEGDTEAIRRKMEACEDTNRAVRMKIKRGELSASMKKCEQMSKSLTEKISEIDAKKENAFKNAKFPIDGLAFDEDGITFNSVPFRQCSSAEQMKICVAMSAALNPKIRVIRLADGSLLDSDSLAYVTKLAEEHDLQIWMERVTDGDGSGVGIVIEDGAVRG